jgi:hypothetical protein
MSRIAAACLILTLAGQSSAHDVVPAATFDARYRAKNAGTISVEVPEVYELVNIMIALAPASAAQEGLVARDNDYYNAVRSRFDRFASHPSIAVFDRVLREQPGIYFDLKMNGYAFEFDRRGRIVRKPVYDRTGMLDSRENTLLAFLADVQKFSDDTKFRTFYRANRATYDRQIAFFRDEADLRQMTDWLERNFARSSRFDSYRIIFSPLVAFNQSATWMESNGFRELQAHINFPYPHYTRRLATEAKLSRRARAVLRGNIAFTELNHGYINPEAEKYAQRAVAAISNREMWVDKSRSRGYYGGIYTFDEYMNWGVASLWITDSLPEHEQQPLIERIETMMTQRRGFPRFKDFNRFLIDLYGRRGTDVTLAELYPQILSWFERRN